MSQCVSTPYYRPERAAKAQYAMGIHGICELVAASALSVKAAPLTTFKDSDGKEQKMPIENQSFVKFRPGCFNYYLLLVKV